MSCDHVEELAAVAAGLPLPPALEAHLAGCGSCRAELAELRSALALVDEALRPLASAEPSPALRARIRERVAASPARPLRDWRFAWTAAAAVVVLATALATALTGWRAWSGRPTVAATGPTALAAAPARDVSAGIVARTDSDRLARASAAPPTEASGQAADAVGKLAPSAASMTSVVAARPRQVRPPGRLAEPEVLVPAGEEQALLRFIALVHQQDARPSALLAAGEPSADLAGPDNLHIEPLEIVPLDPAEAQGT